MMLGLEQNGPVFLGLLTLVFLGLIVQSVQAVLAIRANQGVEKVHYYLSRLRQLGVLAAVLGVLGQSVGLYYAFRVIEQAQLDVSPALLWQGVGTSFVTTLYGLGQLALAILAHLLLGHWHKQRCSPTSPS
ncbi:MAG TPA: hypothetical protein DCE41_26685 [Cytophagales bacterium]|nr:hypothetical protein [Cytophagales bacterium]HAA20484.1 hypothetical protein [Cytophagales bacterium]HAP64117.1 hypothetical protein [Cytophagales bacterium]